MRRHLEWITQLTYKFYPTLFLSLILNCATARIHLEAAQWQSICAEMVLIINSIVDFWFLGLFHRYSCRYSVWNVHCSSYLMAAYIQLYLLGFEDAFSYMRHCALDLAALYGVFYVYLEMKGLVISILLMCACLAQYMFLRSFSRCFLSNWHLLLISEQNAYELLSWN